MAETSLTGPLPFSSLSLFSLLSPSPAVLSLFMSLDPSCVQPYIEIVSFRSVSGDREEDLKRRSVSAAQKNACLYLCFKSVFLKITITFCMFQHWIGQEKTSLSVHNYSCCCHVCLASQYPAGRPAWRCSVKCWTQNSVLFFLTSHILFSFAIAASEYN